MAIGVALFAATVAIEAQQPTGPAPQPAAAATCTITGSIAGAGTPLPGVSITVRRGDTLLGGTASTMDGTFRFALPDGAYHVTFDLTGFARAERDLTVDRAAGCQAAMDVSMSLAPRTAARSGGPGPVAAAAAPPAAGAPPADSTTPGGRFETLQVTEQAAAPALDLTPADTLTATPETLLPPGFGSEALSDAFAVTGETARVDRGALNDRRDAFNRGDFQIPANEGGGGFGEGGGTPTLAGIQGGGNIGGGGGRGGRGGGGNQFFLGGRGGRQSRLQANVTYRFSGSALNSAPRQLRSEVRGEERPFSRQNFSINLGGPFRIPGIYENANNQTNFQVQYSGNTGGNLFDQYATVPTDAMRAGDFSAQSTPLIDPATGLAFDNNQIPTDRISPQALALLRYFPAANLSGNTRNYHYATTTLSTGNSFSLRVQHNFSGNAAGGRGGGRGGTPTATRSNAGQAGRGRRLLAPRTNVNMNAQVQYSNNQNDQTNVFATLGGRSESTSLGIPVSFDVQRGRARHQLSFNFSRTTSQTTNRFTGLENVASLAGIAGVATDSFSWGLPALSFSSISGLRDTTPSQRFDRRLSASYNWQHPWRRTHQLRAGGDFRYDVSRNNTEQNANGSFIFTGIYTSAGGNGGLTGFDFADFLLGMPQQASINYGPGTTTLTGRSMSLFLQDEWRARPSLTMQLGVRYELMWPFVEQNGHLVNLDVTPDFTAAAPVEAGQVGAYTGEFPAGLLLTDKNNAAPRVGFAWRAPHALIVRGGYGIQYNNGTYASIARQLAQQPPFATSGTNIGGLATALLMENALTGISPSDTRNNYGIDKDYVLGRVETYNVDLQRSLGRAWQASANYTHTRGSNLDIVRAPNRNTDGTLRIEGVQPFTWQSAEGQSVLNSATFALQHRQTRGVSYSAQYTLAKSRDNSPSIGGGGGGGGNVAQNDQDINAEWGLSNFDQRQRLTLQLRAQLPFGQGKRWLDNGGIVASILDNWEFNFTFQADSGRPLTATVRGAARDVSTGVNGALRADYNGAPITIDNPTIDRYFNTDAFGIPATGLFGSSPRNVIIGPGSRQLNGGMSRAVPLGGNRVMQLQISANNLLNMVNYTSVDTNVNSPTFGQVLGIRPMRSANLNVSFRF